jgi:hypothetical protein
MGDIGKGDREMMSHPPPSPYLPPYPPISFSFTPRHLRVKRLHPLGRYEG